MEKPKNEPQEEMLTTRMDFGTEGFDEFQAILLKKAKTRSDAQIRRIFLLTFKYKMEDYVNSDRNEVKSAGEFLKIILSSLHIQQNKFADYIGLKPSNLSKLINGERSINYELALIFGQLFNHNPMLWVEIQAKNELHRVFNANSGKYSDYSLNDLIKGE